MWAMGLICPAACFFLIKIIKFYWITAMRIHLSVDYGCFYMMLLELGSWDRDSMSHKAKNIYYLDIYVFKIYKIYIYI